MIIERPFSRISNRVFFSSITAFLFAAPLSCRDDSSSSVDGGDASAEDASAYDSESESESERIWIPKTADSEELPDGVSEVEILISDEARASLEAAPFYGDDVKGTFVDEGGKAYAEVDLNFRGAYALGSLLDNDPIGRRNWKVKFSSEDKYRNLREWNFTFEPHLRQKLAYDLMKFSGVKVPSAEHVLLKVNGDPQGLYLRYEDPDNKDWLFEKFGSDEGDLYKAALDLPASEGEPEKKYFADTTYLGDKDADYLYHYNKKTNHKDPLIADDFSVIREFLDGLNHTSDDELAPWIAAHFEVDAFLKYLVVSNFISNWDGFPQRSKNFWLYENRRDGRMVFIPWDMDATFQTWVDDFNQMGPEAPVLFSLESLDYRPIHEQEGTDRPLAFRLFADEEFERAYIAKYRALLETLLSASYLETRVDALDALVSPHLSDEATSSFWEATERSDYEGALSDLRDFISARVRSVTEQLGELP